MKKKFISVILSTIVAISITACNGSGVSQEEYNKVVKERDEYKAQLEELTGTELSSTDNEDAETIGSDKHEFRIGDTWEVEGKFNLTVNSVSASDFRNQFDESNPSAVYVINYTYENLGLQEDLYISMESQIVDSAGKMGTSYPGDYTMYPQPVPTGANCEAEAWIAVENPGNFKIYVSVYDDDYNEHSAIFNLTVS